MAEPTIQLGGGNWAGKSGNLLGYYEQNKKFYAEDFTFSRSTTGTYTDSDGYIQEMPYNLLTYSEDFSNASWVKSNVTIETSINTSPLGYSQKIVGSNNTSLKLLYKNNIITPTKTISALVKAEGYNYAIIFTGGGARVVFDLVNGVVGQSIGTFGNASINSQGDGWYIISMSNPNHTSYASVTGAASNSVYDRTGNGVDGISLAYIQVNKGSSAKTYFPTTTRLNMPRVSYLNNSNGSLILEPQRSNLVTYSSDFSEWSNQSTITLTSNFAISPDGTLNADKLTSANISSAKKTPFVLSVSTTYNASIFLKNINSSRSRVECYAGVSGNPVIEIDWNEYTPSTFVSYNTTNVEYINCGNNWWRVNYTFTSNASATNYETYVYPDRINASDSILVFGAQVEQGSYPTTLINTSGSSVTRNADACTDGGDASRFNSSEGVLYAEIAALEETSSSSKYISISDETYNNRLSILFSSGATNQIRAFLRVGGVSQVDFNGSVTDVTDYNKVAFKYKDNDFSLWINGVEVATDTSGSTFSADTLAKLSFSEINTTSGKFEGKVKDLKVYNTALSDSELVTLTTL